MNTRNLLLVFLLLAFAKQDLHSQFGFSHEIGVITGPVVFYSDYGQRYDFETNAGNVGIGIGLVHYINFSYRADCNCYTRDTYFNDHFKIRSELDYHKTNFEHFGEWVDPDRESITANQLRAMKGSTRVIELGAQLEYFPLSIRDFAAGGFRLAPFASLGAHWVNYDPEVYSELGDLVLGVDGDGNQIFNPETVPAKYFDSFQQDSDSTWAIVMSLGTRYKLGPLSDLMLDARWTYYLSNWVDGLNPDVPENKANDWNFWINIGYIYYID
ncbi:THC0290_0291 family protein [Altibacter sp. HG106]|uniref:THC0290_0291 family protein n=1 Tax=Altibacter sp. HG106 TaxID=3023937 RepID=UPI002350FDF7|nr:glutamate dehydrogenase [Altibacter sp. HG106]MDC7994837.1 glutamate dehydrogenase [Altibacter sp. HG106]